ncbi:MAG TPA: hypothetical protein VIE90_12285 [Candidatus Binatia bacterium]|jgi:hypothetical protein
MSVKEIGDLLILLLIMLVVIFLWRRGEQALPTRDLPRASHTSPG